MRHQFLSNSLGFKTKFSVSIILNSHPKMQKKQKIRNTHKLFYRKDFLKFTSHIYKGNFRVIFFVLSWQGLVHTVSFWNIKKLLQPETQLDFFNLLFQNFNLVFKTSTPRFLPKSEKNEIAIALKNIRRSTA